MVKNNQKQTFSEENCYQKDVFNTQHLVRLFGEFL